MYGTCGAYGGKKRYKRRFGGEARGKEATWKIRCRWEENIKAYFQETGLGGAGESGLKYFGSGKGHIVKFCENRNEFWVS
jgi:hypothetical protein